MLPATASKSFHLQSSKPALDSSSIALVSALYSVVQNCLFFRIAT